MRLKRNVGTDTVGSLPLGRGMGEGAGFTILGAINWIPKWYRRDGALSSVEIAERIADQLLRSLRP